MQKEEKVGKEQEEKGIPDLDALIKYGKISKEVLIGSVKVRMETLTSEEQNCITQELGELNSLEMTDPRRFAKEKDLILSYSIKSINGVSYPREKIYKFVRKLQSTVSGSFFNEYANLVREQMDLLNLTPKK